ncbi:MAG: pirin family protein [Candidatus Omnitrophica bacterium]|nr:pirin family protein [Candidatus Omnitrophota bacterium]
MIQIRKAGERGHANHGWLDSYHTFSFADYHDPKHMGFRCLRVINEDRIEPGKGFGTHGHRDMEIITYILEGELEHRDSMGSGAVIRPGEVQRMSAGTGVTHSEFNPSRTNPVHLLQIWILPEKNGLKPGYEQRAFKPELRKNRLCLAAAGRPSAGALKIHQDASLYISSLEKGKKVEYAIDMYRHAWIQAARGSVQVNGVSFKESDGAAVSGEKLLTIAALSDAELLLFDMA